MRKIYLTLKNNMLHCKWSRGLVHLFGEDFFLIVSVQDLGNNQYA